MKCHTSTKSVPTAEDVLLLDNQLCFALYAATRAITRTYRERLNGLHLTYPQYLVLLVLWQDDELTVSEIGRKLMLDSGTLTPLIKRMESLKLVTRLRGKIDEREVQIRLLAKGKNLKSAALDARRHVACRLDMAEPEILAFRAELMAMIERLNSKPQADAAE